MRKAREIAEDIANLKMDMEVLRARLDGLNCEHNISAVAEASHPWLGKKVKRTLSTWRNKDRGQKGTVTAFDRTKHLGLRQLPYKIGSGDLIVVSDSGQTAIGFQTMPTEPAWELS